MFSARAAVASSHVVAAPCYFCACSSDSVEHITRCQFVLAAYDSVCASSGMPPMFDGRRVLMLQDEMDAPSIAGVVAFFAATWEIRAMRCRGVPFHSHDDFVELILCGLRCPWLLRCCKTMSKRDRRRGRIRDPKAGPHATIYRSDGACRNQGLEEEQIAG